MIGSREQMFKEIFTTGCRTFLAYSSPVLGFIFIQGSSFYVAGMRDGDHYLLIGNHIFNAKISACIFDYRPAGIAVLFFYFDQFVLDNLHSSVLIGQDIL